MLLLRLRMLTRFVYFHVELLSSFWFFDGRIIEQSIILYICHGLKAVYYVYFIFVFTEVGGCWAVSIQRSANSVRLPSMAVIAFVLRTTA
jgi:hypothetical protein